MTTTERKTKLICKREAQNLDRPAQSPSQDFAGYETKSFMRRVRPRMQFLRLHSVHSYINVLNRDAPEVINFVRDLLINVRNSFETQTLFRYSILFMFSKSTLLCFAEQFSGGFEVSSPQVSCVADQDLVALSVAS